MKLKFPHNVLLEMCFCMAFLFLPKLTFSDFGQKPWTMVRGPFFLPSISPLSCTIPIVRTPIDNYGLSNSTLAAIACQCFQKATRLLVSVGVDVSFTIPCTLVYCGTSE